MIKVHACKSQILRRPWSGGSQFRVIPRQKVWNPIQKISKTKKGWPLGQIVERQPSKQKALSSNQKEPFYWKQSTISVECSSNFQLYSSQKKESNNLKIHMDTQMTLKSQSNLEQREQSLKSQYSISMSMELKWQNTMELEEKQIRKQMEQIRKYRRISIQYSYLILDKVTKI
jgi:hypothetical protein